MNNIVFIAIIIGIALIVGLVSIYFWGKDNPVEEACEAIIKEETGINIDLSPEATPSTSKPADPNAGNKVSS